MATTVASTTTPTAPSPSRGLPPNDEFPAELRNTTATMNGSSTPTRHRKQSSSLSDLTLVELERSTDTPGVELHVNENPDAQPAIPISTLVVVTDSEKLQTSQTVLTEVMSDFGEYDFTLEDGAFKVKNWAGEKGYSDYIAMGLKLLAKNPNLAHHHQTSHAKIAAAASSAPTNEAAAPAPTQPAAAAAAQQQQPSKVVMLFESPTTSSGDFTFQNKNKFRFHDWPPPSKTGGKSVLGPCRYALMNGTSFPVFLKDGTPPVGLVEHWKRSVPGFQEPSYVNTITDAETVYAYLPVEAIRNHVNDPNVHYHLAGKDAIHMMTQKTTSLLPDTRTVRPCVVKTTHSMGSKGIFIINNDDDEKQFEKFLEDSGHPTYVITNFVDIARNVACHFFIFPNGSIVWFGSNENHREADGRFSSDSYLILEHQDKLKEIQLPFVEEVVQYCHGLGFWGFCGIDVLFDSQDRGYLVDINPRVTGSCPALMTLKRLNKAYGFTVGLFRRSGKTAFYGTADELFEQVAAYNDANEGKSRIVIHSLFHAPDAIYTRINIGVYGTNLSECKMVLNQFAHAAPKPTESTDAPVVANGGA